MPLESISTQSIDLVNLKSSYERAVKKTDKKIVISVNLLV